jgi:subtilisin-like proprotein convertase family protein
MRKGSRPAALLTLGAITTLALPAVAGANTVTLTQDQSGSGINFDFASPANTAGDVYPSTINGPAGTVNDVNISVQEQHASPDDLDIALVSPNGTAVHLVSDACGSDNQLQTLQFDDSAEQFLSDLGPCDQSLTYRPSNYGEVPDPYPAPGPAAGTLASLSSFNGGPSTGAWKLFATDDTMGNGGQITVWTMTLDYTPAAPTNPTPAPSTNPTTPATRCKKKKKKKHSAASAKCKKKKKKK